MNAARSPLHWWLSLAASLAVLSSSPDRAEAQCDCGRCESAICGEACEDSISSCDCSAEPEGCAECTCDRCAAAETCGCDGAAGGCDAAAQAPPAPDYDGCLCCRSVLTGDWCGHRDCFAECGITFDLDHVYVYQGVTSGGLDQDWAWGGHGDYLVNVDFGKLCGQEGLFLKLRAEHNFGDTVNRDTGALFPVALQPILPARTEDLCLTNVLFTQALSEDFAVFAGKLDMLDSDANAFAHGRGKTQFMNLAFCVNPLPLGTVPVYSTLGAGFAFLYEGQPLWTVSVINAVDTATTSGFDVLFEEGAILASELRLPTQFFGLPGHQLFGGAWNSKTFVALGQDPRILLPGGGVPIAPIDGSWSLYWNCDQYLSTYNCDGTKGWGVFARAAVSDGNPNFMKSFYSVGIGGDSPLAGRQNDRFGVGWYYAKASDELGIIATQRLNVGDGQGVELFYNYEVTPWFHFTPDLQIIKSGRTNVDTAVVAGFRAEVDF
jgi:porin